MGGNGWDGDGSKANMRGNGGKGSANTVVPAAHPIIVALLFYGRFWVAAGLRYYFLLYNLVLPQPSALPD
jgi:hypothetical protein